MDTWRTCWGDKPYHSLDYYLRQTFGEKVYRISLNAGCTCPNRDGTLGSRGCIFCSAHGSGDFAAPPQPSVTAQIEAAKEQLAKKRGCRRFIAYFQAFTNTYGPIGRLRQVYLEAVSHPDIAVLSIATRPDCLPPEMLDLLEDRLDDVEYGEDQIIMLQLKADEDGYYTLVDSGIQKLDEVMIDYYGTYTK